MNRLQRKSYWIDATLVKKAMKLLGAKSESEAIRKAISLTVLQKEAGRAWIANAGRGADYASKRGDR